MSRKGSDSLLPPGCRWAQLKEICAEDGERVDGRTQFAKRSVMRWLEAGKFVVHRPTPGRVLIAVREDGTPFWRDDRPRAARVTIRPAKGRQEASRPRKALLAEYRQLAASINAPRLLSRAREPEGWRLRHEYLRRKLERPESERLLSKQHRTWPESATGEDGVRDLTAKAWLLELRSWLLAEGESVPAPGLLLESLSSRPGSGKP